MVGAWGIGLGIMGDRMIGVGIGVCWGYGQLWEL